MLSGLAPPVDPVALHDARAAVRAALAAGAAKGLRAIYLLAPPPDTAAGGEGGEGGGGGGNDDDDAHAALVGWRRLRNAALGYLCAARDGAAAALAFGHFANARVMTDRLAALALLASIPGAERDEARRPHRGVVASVVASFSEWRGSH